MISTEVMKLDSHNVVGGYLYRPLVYVKNTTSIGFNGWTYHWPIDDSPRWNRHLDGLELRVSPAWVDHKQSSPFNVRHWADLAMASATKAEYMRLDHGKWVKDDSPKTIGDIYLLADHHKYLEKPAMSPRDNRKLGKMISKALTATVYSKYRGNSGESSQVLSLIEKVSKLSAKALDNPELKQEIIDNLWIAYAEIEANGLDDAHYIQSDIPCNEYGAGKIYNRPRNRLNNDYQGYVDWVIKEFAKH